MKYMVLFALLSINCASNGMEFLKGLREKVATFITNNSASEPIAQSKGKPLPPLPLSKNPICEYQRIQNQNVTSALTTLFLAGFFKFNANQSHSGGDAYFNYNAATWFSLGVSATFVYKFCTTPMPVQKLEYKNK